MNMFASKVVFHVQTPLQIAMFLSNGFSPDIRVFKEARSLVGAGYCVHIICWDRTGAKPAKECIERIYVQRVQISSFYGRGNRQWWYLIRFWVRAILSVPQLKPDIIHCHDLDTAPIGYFSAKLAGIPWVYDAHECYPDLMANRISPILVRFLRVMERFLSPRADRVITVGNRLAEYFRNQGARVSIVGNFQPIAQDTGGDKFVQRSELGIPDESLVLIYVGGLTQGRLFESVIHAVSSVENAWLLVFGKGPLEEALRQWCSGCERTRYMGFLSREALKPYFPLADAFYYGLSPEYTNNRYSCPNALFDALSSGKPVLTTNVGEIAEIVHREKCGIVVDDPTPANFRWALRKLQRPEQYGSMARHAKRAGDLRYNWNIAERSLLNVYGQLAQRFQKHHCN